MLDRNYWFLLSSGKFKKILKNLTQSARGDGLKVLIVEDDPLIVKIYEVKLRDLGFEIKALRNAEGNFVKQVGDFNPDLILLDLILCGEQEHCIDGFAAYEMLKLKKETRDIPVIFLTNRFDQSDIDRAKILGADSYIIKAGMTPSQVAGKILETIQLKQRK